MNTPEHKAKVHTPEIAARRGRTIARLYAEGSSPGLERNRERIRTLNPMVGEGSDAVRRKCSEVLRAMGYAPKVRGGNGHPLTAPQAILLAALGPPWVAEHAVSLGPRQAGYPTSYKLDLADPARKVGVEVDGHSHRSRRALDRKKDEKLASLGWTVLRIWNADVLDWNDAGRAAHHRVSVGLALYDIRCALVVDPEAP